MPISHNRRGNNTGQKQVKRYWPGKVPEWANDGSEEEAASLEKAFPRHEEEDTTTAIVRNDDRRLRRLAESRIDNRDEIRADHRRRIRLAEIDSSIEEEGLELEHEEDDDDDVDALAERRRQIKEKNKMLREREEEEEEALPHDEEEEEEEEALPEEIKLATVMEKPGFVPKRERYTVAERDRVKAEERDLKEAKKRRLEERRIESKEIVVKEINKKLQKKNMELESNIDEVDTDDKLNEAEEYKDWVVREMGRIKRDREVREAMLKVRNTKEEVRREWERKNPKPSKQKRLYMQKYYHKGAFFQSDPDDQAATVGTGDIIIFVRDFSAPTGEDKMDKTILPKVMQVKNFGRSGRTKWTHLVNEDTTDWNNPWTYNDPLRAKYNDKMAAMNAPITKPKGSRKLKDWGPR